MELCEGGAFRYFAVSQEPLKGPNFLITRETLKVLFSFFDLTFCLGLIYLHNHGIIHRDEGLMYTNR